MRAITQTRIAHQIAGTRIPSHRRPSARAGQALLTVADTMSLIAFVARGNERRETAAPLATGLDPGSLRSSRRPGGLRKPGADGCPLANSAADDADAGDGSRALRVRRLTAGWAAHQ